MVEARVMTKKMRVLDPKTGKITSKAVRYPHGGLRISCYMTDELFKVGRCC